MKEQPARGDKAHLILLVWAIIATLLAVFSTGLTVYFALHPVETRAESQGWIRWEKAQGGNGHHYKAVLSQDGLTWRQADELARAMDGHLATISSEAENQFVFELVNAPEFFTRNGEGPALGGYQQEGASEPDGGWSWVSGEPWAYRNWFVTEPNNGRYKGGTENRLHFYSGNPKPAATWNDTHLEDRKAPGFIVEREN